MVLNQIVTSTYTIKSGSWSRQRRMSRHCVISKTIRDSKDLSELMLDNHHLYNVEQCKRCCEYYTETQDLLKLLQLQSRVHTHHIIAICSEKRRDLPSLHRRKQCRNSESVSYVRLKNLILVRSNVIIKT